jgi:hypothetical protein
LIIENGATITTPPLLDLTIVDSSGYSHLQMENEKVKMYFLDKKVYLTVDVPFYKTGTNLFELDLETGKYNSEIVIYPKSVSSTTKQNSFIHGNKFFSIKADSKEVKINIYNFESRETLKELIISNKEKNIPFANTQLIKLGYGWDASSQKTISKPKQITNKMLRQNTAITASTNKLNKLVLSIGSYSYYAPNYTNYNPNSLNPLTQNIFSQANIPKGLRISPRVRSAYFQSKLNFETLEVEEGQLKESRIIASQRKIWLYKKKLKSEYYNPLHCAVSFELNKKLYFGYYTKSKKEFEFIHLK